MYLPLRFMEQMENYIQIPSNRSMESVCNNKSLEWVEKQGSDSIVDLYMRKDEYSNGSGMIKEGKEEELRDLVIGYQVYTQGIPVINIDDWFDQLLFSSIHDMWGKYKLAYKIDSELVDTLCNMKLPDFCSSDILTKIPACCFYIDFGDYCPFCDDSNGLFAVVKTNEERISVVLVSLINSERVIPITSRIGVNLDGAKLSEVKVTFNMNVSGLALDCEDGKLRHLHEEKYFIFFFNFLLYLQAANRDVVINDQTEKIYKERKPDAKPKNQFKEVKLHDVGIRYGKKISQSGLKIVHKGEHDRVGNTREISSHYRSAHWHHYWVGSGDDKELVIKWVEGVFVHGSKESTAVVVHKVE